MFLSYPPIILAATATLLTSGMLQTAAAQERPNVADTIVGLVTSLEPKTRYTDAEVQREVIVARRIDIVDPDGVVRMTLAGQLPNPVVDGVEYRRSSPVSGVMLRDAQGNERGGFGYHDALGGANPCAGSAGQ
jgi:hypothetical protein